MEALAPYASKSLKIVSSLVRLPAQQIDIGFFTLSSRHLVEVGGISGVWTPCFSSSLASPTIHELISCPTKIIKMHLIKFSYVQNLSDERLDLFKEL